MNRKMIIILAVQSAAILLLLGFGFIQKAEADRQREIAEEAVMAAEAAVMVAGQERQASMMARAEAERQREIAESQRLEALTSRAEAEKQRRRFVEMQRAAKEARAQAELQYQRAKMAAGKAKEKLIRKDSTNKK